jgi:methionyl-tRNA formyltransferase
MSAAKTKVVFMGGKKIGFLALQYLLEHSSQLNVEVIAVFENKAKVLSDHLNQCGSLAKAHNIPLYHSLNDQENLPVVEIIISVQYHEILKPKDIQKARNIAINLHMAPVPEYRGCNQFSFAIADNASEFGTTLHRMEAGIDSGAIIAEKRFPIPPNCFVKELYETTLDASIQLFKEELANVINGHYLLTPQGKLTERKKGFHLREEIEELKQIDPNWPIEKQKRIFRATWFPPFPPPVNAVSGEALTLEWYNQLG